MTTPSPSRVLTFVLPAIAALSLSTVAAGAQGEPGAPPSPMRQAAQLDRDGQTAQARRMFQAIIDSAADPAAKAQAHRAMAMSYAFDRDCANMVKFETLVIAYWATREQADPQNAFYEQGEMANEAARVCLDAGDLDAAERWYRRGYELGTKEPAPQKHPRSLWEYRLAHALGRIAARRGDTAQARQQVAAARRALDGDTAMAAQQERYFPYLVGYVALYTNDLASAEAQLTKAVGTRGNERDAFMHCLLGLALEHLGRQEEAKAAAFVRPFAREKLGLAGSR